MAVIGPPNIDPERNFLQKKPIHLLWVVADFGSRRGVDDFSGREAFDTGPNPTGVGGDAGATALRQCHKLH